MEEVFGLLESSTLVSSKGNWNEKDTWPSRPPIQIKEMATGGISLAGVTEPDLLYTICASYAHTPYVCRKLSQSCRLNFFPHIFRLHIFCS